MTAVLSYLLFCAVYSFIYALHCSRSGRSPLAAILLGVLPLALIAALIVYR